MQQKNITKQTAKAKKQKKTKTKILCYLPPSNLRENGAPVCIHDK